MAQTGLSIKNLSFVKSSCNLTLLLQLIYLAENFPTKETSSQWIQAPASTVLFATTVGIPTM